MSTASPVVKALAVTLRAFPAVVFTDVRLSKLPAPVVDEPTKFTKLPVKPVVVPDCVTLSAVVLTWEAFVLVISSPLFTLLCEIVAAVAGSRGQRRR